MSAEALQLPVRPHIDGYTGIIPRTSATVPEVLHHYGYKSAAFGKWHNTPAIETTAIGPKDRWPNGYGFEYFYGFVGGATSQWEPTLFENTRPVVLDRPRHEAGIAAIRDAGARVLIGDPERSYFPHGALEQVAEYRVATLRALEDQEQARRVDPGLVPHLARLVVDVQAFAAVAARRRHAAGAGVRAGEQAEHVGAHRVEGHVAQVEQAGITDHDVEAQRQQHVEQGQRHDAHPALAELCRHFDPKKIMNPGKLLQDGGPWAK